MKEVSISSLSLSSSPQNFHQILEKLNTPTKTRDPRSVRLMAVSSALLETILDRHRSLNKSGNYKDIIPFEIFGCSITALEGTIVSGDAQLEQQLPLLQILQMVLPYCSMDNSKEMFLSQYKLLSRVLRSLKSYYSNFSCSLETKDELGGGNAMLRHIITCARESILVYNQCNTKEYDEVVKKLYEVCFIQLLEDKRPKVRRTAQSAIMEFLDTWLETHFISYCLNYVKQYKKNEESMMNLTHLFNFLQSIIGTIQSSRGEVSNTIIQVADEVMKVSMVILKSYKDEEYKINLIHSSWNVILTLLEGADVASDEILSFASRVLATLLQIPNGRPFHTPSPIQNHCHVLYTKLIVSSFTPLSSSQQHQDICKRLQSTAFGILIHACDYIHQMEDEEEKRAVLQSCAVECQRFLALEMGGVETYVQSLGIFLQVRYRASYDVVLPCFATGLATILSSTNNTKAQELLQELVDMHMAKDKNTQLCIENAVGKIIQRIGIQSFLTLIPLGSTNTICIPTKERAWLIPLLKIHGGYNDTPTKLSYFQEGILPLARKCDDATSTKLTPLQVSIEKRKCVELWSLFSCFCKNPCDVSSAFPKLLPVLLKAMQDERYPSLVNTICSGITTLAQNAKDADLKCISSSTTKILPTLFKLVDTLSGANNDMEVDTKQENQKNPYQVQFITKAISSLAKIAPPKFLQNLFQKLLQRLVASTSSISDNEEQKISSLLNLSQGLVSSQALSNECILLLYKSIKPCIIVDNDNAQVMVKIQKKAYKVMAELCQYYTSFLLEEERRKDVMELLLGSVVTCHVSCRYWRLTCLFSLIEGYDNPMEIIPQIMGEVILCLKDRNTKTRELGYQLILKMYESIDDDNAKQQFFQVVTAGLAGQTAAMRSASVMALSRLVFELARGDDVMHDLLPDLLSTVLLVLHQGNSSVKREEIKSSVSFIRVTIAAMSSDQLEPLLGDIISTLFQQQKKLKRFRSKIKIILQKLVKVYGYEKVTPFMPEKDVKLLEYLKKTQQKEMKKKNANDNATTRTDANFDQMMDLDEDRDDSDDEEDSITEMSKSTKYTTKSGKSNGYTKDDKSFKSTMAKTKATSKSINTTKSLLIRNEKNDVHDFLHSNMYQNLQMLNEEDEYEDSDFDFSDDDADALEFDDDGKLIVPDDNKKESDDDSDSESDKEVQKKQRRISKHQTVKEAKQNKNKVKELGAAYKSKKAKGDVKLKHQTYEPYAYVPLDSRNYSKKKRGMTVKQMGSVVNSNKRKRR